MTLKIDVNQRNGKNFMTISDSNLTNHASYFQINYTFLNIPSTITSIVSGVVNSNWRIIKPLVDPTISRFVSDGIQKFGIQPIFNKFDLQEIFGVLYNKNYTCENFC